jgi:hypothetical protein
VGLSGQTLVATLHNDASPLSATPVMRTTVKTVGRDASALNCLGIEGPWVNGDAAYAAKP